MCIYIYIFIIIVIVIIITIVDWHCLIYVASSCYSQIETEKYGYLSIYIVNISQLARYHTNKMSNVKIWTINIYIYIQTLYRWTWSDWTHDVYM